MNMNILSAMESQLKGFMQANTTNSTFYLKWLQDERWLKGMKPEARDQTLGIAQVQYDGVLNECGGTLFSMERR